MLIGALIGGETFTTHDLGAMAVILVGVVLITLAKARASTPPPTPAAMREAAEEPAA